MTVDVPITSIVIGTRSRTSMRDIDSLARSIGERGLLQPPVVRRVSGQYRLVCGERRIRAMQRLGWTETAITVATTLDDEIEALLAEGDENTERVPFTAAEAVAHSKRIKNAQAEKSRLESVRSQAQNRKRDERGRVTPSGGEKFAPPASPDERKTRTRVARSTGFSAPTLKKAESVIDIAADESQPEPVRKIAKAAAKRLDSPGAKVDREFRDVERAVMEHSDQAQAYQDAQWRKSLSKELGKVIDLRTFDPERVVAVCDDDLLFLIDRTCQGIAEWHEQITQKREPGLRVVHGGNR